MHAHTEYIFRYHRETITLVLWISLMLILMLHTLRRTTCLTRHWGAWLLEIIASVLVNLSLRAYFIGFKVPSQVNMCNRAYSWLYRNLTCDHCHCRVVLMIWFKSMSRSLSGLLKRPVRLAKERIRARCCNSSIKFWHCFREWGLCDWGIIPISYGSWRDSIHSMSTLANYVVTVDALNMLESHH